MSNDPTSRRPANKSGNTGAPMGSTISIIVAGVAVIVGFLILKNLKDDGGASVKSETPPAVGLTPTSTTQPTNQPTTVALTSPPTTAVIVTTGATLIVANASGIDGAAGRFTDSLGKVGFTTGTATNAAGAEVKLDVSKVYYVPGPAAEAVARSVAQTMGGVVVEPVPTPVNIKEGALGDATVLVMLGKDMADKPLAALADATPTTPPVSAALAPTPTLTP